MMCTQSLNDHEVGEKDEVVDGHGRGRVNDQAACGICPLNQELKLSVSGRTELFKFIKELDPELIPHENLVRLNLVASLSHYISDQAACSSDTDGGDAAGTSFATTAKGVLPCNLLRYLPRTIENCRSLEELNANFNQLTKLPDTIRFELLNLKKLSVNSNKLVFLPSSTSHLTNLRDQPYHKHTPDLIFSADDPATTSTLTKQSFNVISPKLAFEVSRV
ncbi:unnamed protein product [Fraxinus pennsylvanica]|uniref:Uncharacterized protein n=1 Tax=Fraxinus pennsylvanica TaxID=56036 RepID=A0AAD2EBM4_9LAMI|nr:unnamed protein product [Fraxinus pennsylvanica]